VDPFFHSRRAWIAATILFFACVGVWSVLLAPKDTSVREISASVLQTFTGGGGEGERVAAVLAKYASTSPEFPTRAKTAGCIAHDSLPDPACSPGAIFADATPTIICVPGYTKTVRNVSTALRKKIYAEYGVEYPQARGAYEVDHLVPLALGGSNDPANLFLEAAEPKPGFKEKDVVEVFLHDEVCAGRINLAAAQQQIARNWVEVYEALDAATVSAIRQKYSSWAN
jgi:hypothetical protein